MNTLDLIVLPLILVWLLLLCVWERLARVFAKIRARWTLWRLGYCTKHLIARRRTALSWVYGRDHFDPCIECEKAKETAQRRKAERAAAIVRGDR